jgi:hypothetical protein
MILRSSLACAVLALSAPAAFAFDIIPGYGIQIEKLVQSYQAVSRHSSLGYEQPYTGTPNEVSAYLAPYGNGALLGWQPLESPSCQTKDGYTSVQLIYSRKGTYSGKFACDPQVQGGASEQHVIKTNGSYTTRTSIKGNVITLSGQMTYKTIYTSKGGFNSISYVKDDTIRINQSLRLKITESGCEVLDYAETAVTKGLAKGLIARGAYTDTSTSHRENGLTQASRCKVY